MTLTLHPLLVPWSRKSRAIRLLTYWPYGLYRASVPVQHSYTSAPLWAVRPVQNLSACTVQLYLYSLYRPYSLYRTSVPVQYSYTSTPLLAVRTVQNLSACTIQLYVYSPIGRTARTEPQCLYSRAIPLLPL